MFYPSFMPKVAATMDSTMLRRTRGMSLELTPGIDMIKYVATVMSLRRLT